MAARIRKSITHRAMSSTCQTIRVGPEHIIARLKALRDPRMRVLALIEALGEDDPTSWVHPRDRVPVPGRITDDDGVLRAREVARARAAAQAYRPAAHPGRTQVTRPHP